MNSRENETVVYRVGADRETPIEVVVHLERAPRESGALPSWTELDYQKCENCTLDPAVSKRCPAAADLVEVVLAFRDDISHETSLVEVETDRRKVSAEVDMQTALASLMGLVMATSGCPHTQPLKPMARFHLPFASREETLFRTVGAHLTRQFVLRERGDAAEIDLESLRDLYQALTIVNTGFTERIRAAARKDANLNALVNLFSLSVLISLSLDDDLMGLAEVVGLPKA